MHHADKQSQRSVGGVKQCSLVYLQITKVFVITRLFPSKILPVGFFDLFQCGIVIHLRVKTSYRVCLALNHHALHTNFTTLQFLMELSVNKCMCVNLRVCVHNCMRVCECVCVCVYLL